MKFSTKELVQTDGDFIGVFISRGYIPAEFRPLEQTCLPSLNLTWPLKIGFPKRKKVFHPSIFRCYVGFREGNFLTLFDCSSRGFLILPIKNVGHVQTFQL